MAGVPGAPGILAVPREQCAVANLKKKKKKNPLQLWAFANKSFWCLSQNVTAPWFEGFFLFVYLFFTGHFCAHVVIDLTEPEVGGDKTVYFEFPHW